MMNEQLISELPELLDLRIPYFDPSFEAMIRMQCKFAEEGYEKLGGVQRSASFCSLVAASLTSRTASSLLFQILRRQRTRRLCGRSTGCTGTYCVAPPGSSPVVDVDVARSRIYSRKCGSSPSAAPAERTSHQCSIHDITLSY